MSKAIGAEEHGPQPLPAAGPSPRERGRPARVFAHDDESSSSPDPVLAPDLAEQTAAPSPLPPLPPVKVSEVPEIPLLSREEKRRILAQIVRVNTLDCFDDSGAFDISRAKQILPPGAIRHIIVHETTRIDPEGQPTTQRKIHLRLVDPLSALRLDDLLERRGQPRPPAAETSFQALRRRTMAEDDEKARLRMEQAQEEERERRMEAAQRALQLEELRQDAAPSQPPDTLEEHAPNVIQAACLFPSSPQPQSQNRSTTSADENSTGVRAFSPSQPSGNSFAQSPTKQSPSFSTATTPHPPLSPLPPIQSPFPGHTAAVTTPRHPARRPRPPPVPQPRFVPPSLCTTREF